MMTLTLDAARRAFFSIDLYFIESENPILEIHDIIHTILRAGPNGAIAEERVSIFQAVLLRSTLVDPRPRLVEDGGSIPTLQEIKELVLPKVRAYLDQQGAKHGYKVKHGLNEAQIDATYMRALILSSLIHAHFGRHLGQIPLEELEALPETVMADLVAHSRLEYDRPDYTSAAYETLYL